MTKVVLFCASLRVTQLFITTCDIFLKHVFQMLQYCAASFLRVQAVYNRSFSKQASGRGMVGDLCAECGSVFDIHENLSTKLTRQLLSEVELRKRSNVASYRIFILILFLATLSSNCYARFTSLDDAAVMQSTSRITEIAEDGSYTTLSTNKFKILKEQGRQFANFHHHYNAGDTEIEIIEAKTIVNGREYNVPKESIEFKPLASAPHGFDQQMQILIAFPNVEVGAEIQLKTASKSKAPLEGYFSDYIVLDTPFHSLNHKFISKIPLHIKINDPENVLDIKKDKSDSFNELEIFLKRPVYRSIIGQSEQGGIINEEKLIVVSISSESDWRALNNRIVSNYEKVLSQKLPTIFEDIAKKAAKFKNNVDVINAVTSLLSEKIQYMGDWRSISGKYFPRDLKTIASSQIGDCKDMSTSTGAILRSLGFKVNSALVNRGFMHPNYIGLPDLDAFNHAFLKVTAKDGSVYWVDPTNDISMAQGIFKDIAGKMALVLDMKSPSYECVPYIDYKRNIYCSKQDAKLLGESGMLLDIELSLQGEDASMYTAAALYLSDDEIKDRVIAQFAGRSLDKKDINYVELPDLKSRIVQDLLFKFSFNENNLFSKTNFGPGISLESFDILDALLNAPEERVTDVLMPGPETTIHRTLFKGMIIPNIDALSFNISNDWFDLSRSLKYNGDDTELLTKFVIKRMIIPNEFLKTEEFQSLKNYYLNAFSNAFLILKQQNSKYKDRK